MGEFFNGVRRNVGCVTLLVVAMAIAAYFVVVRIRTGFTFRDHNVIGPVFLVAAFGTFTSPIIGGVIAALIGRHLERYEYRWLVATGVAVGFGLSAICFRIARHVAFEYLA